MSLGELLLTALVALLVFGPEHLPMLARHLGKVMRQVNHYKQLAQQFWDSHNNQLQLDENIKKAQAADEKYTLDTNQSGFKNNTP